jgi:hypothetical protein
MNTHVKVSYGNEFRRFKLFADQTYHTFVETITSLCGTTEDLVLKYLDEENEWITFSSDIELLTAIEVSGDLLRIDAKPKTVDNTDPESIQSDQLDDSEILPGSEDPSCHWKNHHGKWKGRGRKWKGRGRGRMNRCRRWKKWNNHFESSSSSSSIEEDMTLIQVKEEISTLKEEKKVHSAKIAELNKAFKDIKEKIQSARNSDVSPDEIRDLRANLQPIKAERFSTRSLLKQANARIKKLNFRRKELVAIANSD